MSEAEQAGQARQNGESRLLAGRYRLGEVLGRGGMGTVWRAQDETLGRVVAVKELRFPSGIDEDEKRRLITRTLREAKAIARIRNNGAVTVYDVVEEDDRPWIVMELVEGRSLAEAIRADGTLTPRRAAEVGLAVLDVLRAAHREGILHRDVKPSNILIAEDGRVVLTDFGIAQVEGDPSITSTGMLVGAPSYISPERARGHKPGPASDMWSLGGLLYAAVEGVPPYDKGSAIATLTAVMTEPVARPENAGPLEKVIYGLLAKDQEQRLDDAGARALLNEVINAPEPEDEPPADATRLVPLPPAPATVPTSLTKAPTSTKSAKSPEAAAGSPAAGAAVAPAAATTVSPSPGTPGTDPHPGYGPPRTAGRAALTDVVPRRTLVVAAIVVVLVVLGAVLAVVLHDGGAGSQEHKGGDKASSGAATGGKDTGKGGGTKDDASESPAGTEDSGKGTGSGHDPGTDDAGTDDGASGGGSGSGDDEPGDDDIVTYHHTQGFSIGLPPGWTYQSTNAAGAHFSGPDQQKLLVGWTTTPKDDPVSDWKNQERYMHRAQYDRIRIAAADYRGWNTADWEFTYVDKGVKYRSVDRGFVVGSSLGYGMMYTAKAADWNGEQRRSTWKTFTESFEPKKKS